MFFLRFFENFIFQIFIGTKKCIHLNFWSQNIAQSRDLVELILKTPKLFENGSLVTELWSLEDGGKSQKKSYSWYRLKNNMLYVPEHFGRLRRNQEASQKPLRDPILCKSLLRIECAAQKNHPTSGSLPNQAPKRETLGFSGIKKI